MCEYRQDHSKVYMERQSRIAKTILKMKNKVGGIHLFRDKSYYTVIKTVWYWWREKHTDNRHNEESEIDPDKYTQAMFHKGTEAFNGRRTVVQ